MSDDRSVRLSAAQELLPGVVWHGELPLNDAARVDSCLLELEDAPFDASRFESEGIALPPIVARSVASRQAEFFYGRLAARVALRKAGLDACPVPIGPFRQPLWPPDITGSLTHCRGFAAAAVAKQCERSAIGIDLERVASGDSLDALVTTTWDADERHRLLGGNIPLWTAALITLGFSAKESLFKAAFPSVQRYFDFDAASIVDVQLDAKLLTLRLNEDLSPLLRHGDQKDVGFNWLRPDLLFTYIAW
jgi:enterobactin synthetase component D